MLSHFNLYRYSKKAMETPRGYSVCKNVRYRCTKQVGYDGKTCDSVVDATAGFKKLAKDAKRPWEENFAETVHYPRSVKCTEFSVRRRNLIQELVFGGSTELELGGTDDEAAAEAAEAALGDGTEEGDASSGAVEGGEESASSGGGGSGGGGGDWLAGVARAVAAVLCPGPGPVSPPTFGALHAAAQAALCPAMNADAPSK